MKETVYKCDRCGSKGKQKEQTVHLDKAIEGSQKRIVYDLCSGCSVALERWLVKSNANSPGDHGPGWRETCHHHVPCAGPCANPSWERV